MKIFIFCLLSLCWSRVTSGQEEFCLFEKCECSGDVMQDEILESNDQAVKIYDIYCRLEETNEMGGFPARDSSPEAQTGRVYIFDLQSNKIRSIPDEAFTGLDVQYLDMNLNEIRVIGNRSLSGLAGSVALDMSYNQIELIEPDAFNHATFELRALKIDSNKLGSMEPAQLSSVFRSLGTLSALQMANNGLSEMPRISHLGQLKQLSLSKNQIEHLGHIPSSVSDLNLDHNRLRSIEADTLANLKELKYLSLDGNQIGHIDPAAFHNLVELVSINLARNYIKHLPDKFLFTLINLDRLDVSSQNQMLNNISAFAFDRQSNEKFIKSIDLSGNRLSHFSGRAFCSRNQTRSYINVIELSLANRLESEVSACWFVHVWRGYHSSIHGLDRRIPKVVFKKSTLFDNADVHTKCSCEFDKARLFVNLDGHCLMDDGQLVPFSSFSCQTNFDKKEVEAQCDSMPEYQCTPAHTTTTTTTTTVTTTTTFTTTTVTTTPAPTTTTAPVQFVH
ncbi:leucine-rich repeat-containing 15, partial [Brachionus plicatilis]